MDKIELGTPNITKENISKLIELFPQVATEVESDGELKQAIDFDALKELLGDVAEGQRERYQFTWPGKREAKAEARRPINKTMIPCPEKSVNWDTTENLYIEGDNLDALKILRETYAGKVKMIYIDPPYNTGNDFIYDDDYSQTKSEYETENADYNEGGGRLVANTESNGKFHSDWCSMIYPRLLLAKDLLTEDGLIFISIDDHEAKNLMSICDEIFGRTNYVETFIWEKTQHFGRQKLNCYNNADYVLCYAKQLFGSSLRELLVERVKTELEDAPLYNASNNVSTLDFPAGTVRFNLKDGVYETSTNADYQLLNPVRVANSLNCNGFSLRFRSRWSNTTVQKEISKGTTFWVKTQNFAIRAVYGEGKCAHESPRQIIFTNTNNPAKTTDRYGNRIDTSENASREVEALIGKAFDYPKPVSLIRYLMEMAWDETRKDFDNDYLALDFFSGSGTTAQAIMEANFFDCGARKFILVQFPEECSPTSDAFNAGYSTICEIGEERIRRAGTNLTAKVEQLNSQLKIGEKPRPIPDVGFRVMHITSSNFEDVSVTPEETAQQSLLDLADNVKEGRTDLDLLFEVLPKFRIPYSSPIEERVLAGKKCFIVDDNQLIACFDTEVGIDTIEEIAKMRPLYAVLRDASMADDATAANFEELFKTYSPDTVRKVI